MLRHEQAREMGLELDGSGASAGGEEGGGRSVLPPPCPLGWGSVAAMLMWLLFMRCDCV